MPKCLAQEAGMHPVEKIDVREASFGQEGTQDITPVHPPIRSFIRINSSDPEASVSSLVK